MKDESLLKIGLGLGVTALLGYYFWPKISSAKSTSLFSSSQQGPSETVDLSRVDGVQRGLLILGFDPGEINGNYNSQTRKAVYDYQKSRSIKVDGEYGPQSRGKMTFDLKSKGIKVIGSVGPTFK